MHNVSAAPGIDAEGERYGVQTATCYRCLNNFCDDDDFTCRDEVDKFFGPCTYCAKNFCERCEPVTYCDKCDVSFCGYCMDGTYCELCDHKGPYCSECAKEETRFVSFPRERVVCNECFYACGGSDGSHDNY